MGFRKKLYDVEEKGLEPDKPHHILGLDGRLVDDSTSSKLPVVEAQSAVATQSSSQTTAEEVHTSSPSSQKWFPQTGPLVSLSSSFA